MMLEPLFTRDPRTESAKADVQLVNYLSEITRLEIYPRSITRTGTGVYFLAHTAGRKHLGIIAKDEAPLAKFQGDRQTRYSDGRAITLMLGPLDPQNAAALCEVLPWLKPRVLGLKKSVGCGDRLGLATPGHIRAVRACQSGVAPILAQQSIREMSRTQRAPSQVLDDAMWGVFQEGWREGFGADADHLKTFDDIDSVVPCGYTFFTFDPGAHVDDDPDTSDRKLDTLPWSELETTYADVRARYGQRPFAVNGMMWQLDDLAIRGALVKYGRAIAHVTRLYRHLAQATHGRAFEVEISVDETATPTSPAEHFIVAGELRRLGVTWVSLAPRFVGRFEKGVDYIGDLETFAEDFAAHVAVAKYWGPYKLSLHSGSDKFSIYPIAAHLAGDHVHLKTAGTSYLEALRTTARQDADLFRKIYALARARYSEERASYHVSAELTKAPDAETLSDAELVTLLDEFNARQMLHVCFGSILAAYGSELQRVLAEHEEAYYRDLEKHFARHLESFCQSAR